jgi:single stranded DNA-binding protein
MMNPTGLEFAGVCVVARDIKPQEDVKEITYISQGKEVKTTKVRLYILAKHVGKEKRADLFRLICWGKLAESAIKYLRKGRLLHVQGRLSQSVWQNKEGLKQSAVELVAEGITYLDQPQKEVKKPRKTRKNSPKKAPEVKVEAPDTFDQL